MEYVRVVRTLPFGIGAFYEASLTTLEQALRRGAGDAITP